MGILACLEAYRIKEQAIEKANSLADENNWSKGRRNAFRHSYWMGLMTLNGFTYEDTIALGVAHEKDTDLEKEMLGTPDSNADLHNNQVGARIGVDVRPWYVGAFAIGTTEDHEKELEDRLFKMVRGGQKGILGEGSLVCTRDGWLTVYEPELH